MKIIAKVVVSFSLVAAAYAVSMFSLPLFIDVDSSASEFLAGIAIISMASASAIALVLMQFVLRPLKSITEGARKVARGNLQSAFHQGEITRAELRKADELSRAVLAYEMMRRRIIELEKSLSVSNKSKIVEVHRIGDELIEKEKVLQRANAKLVGQREELERINSELSSRNRELLEANEKLQKLDKMKTDFILIAAHELRTPIQPIVGSVQLAEKGMISIDQAWKQIVNESRRLANVANYILDVGRIESGTFTYDMKPLRIKQLIGSVTSTSSKLASEDGVITISVNLEDDVTIVGDKDRLVQGLSNIITNAVKFAKNGSITIRTRSDYDNGIVEIKIIDDGPGIPPDILPLLFTKFVTKTQENERGTGLGLFITKTIVEGHGGTIKAENNSGGARGAVFTITLPIKVQQVRHALT
ncbi:MAG: ATP-binding protein [Nitrososphaera sp.]|nr:ATP-binding protein [Nitrososphaera sp.]